MSHKVFDVKPYVRSFPSFLFGRRRGGAKSSGQTISSDETTNITLAGNVSTNVQVVRGVETISPTHATRAISLYMDVWGLTSLPSGVFISVGKDIASRT